MPLRDTKRIVMGHGGGGILSEELIENLFLPAFGSAGGPSRDSAVLETGTGRIALTTDSYVVNPLFFPGGSIGDLAVNGTINDLACSGAQPLALTAGFILEEGLEVEVLGAIAQAMGRAAADAGVAIVTGDTKVVGRGSADGLFINTAGVGVVPDGLRIGPEQARPGDHILVSGPIGEHGVAIMSVREGIDFGTTVTTDSAPLHRLVAAMLAALADEGADPNSLHALRDPTRGGLVAATVEIARTSRVGVELDERAIPVPETVASACGFLGLDPLQVANEGKMVAFVDPAHSEAVLAAMRSRPEGAGAAIIGRAVEEHPGMVVIRTPFGTTRVVERELGEQLPRIC
jgi:hydrogenase expression/formation protein HypE